MIGRVEFEFISIIIILLCSFNLEKLTKSILLVRRFLFADWLLLACLSRDILEGVSGLMRIKELLIGFYGLGICVKY